MDILKRIDFVQQFAKEYADGAWSIETEKWKHHVTPEFIEDIRQYIVSLQLKLMHLQTQQAKAAVAWRLWNGGLQGDGNVYVYSEDGDGEPLYTTQPQRKPLTDEDIKEAAPSYAVDDFLDFNAGVRFAEAAHNIKEA